MEFTLSLLFISHGLKTHTTPGQGNQSIIVRSSFSKSPVFKMLSVHKKFVRFEESFRGVPFSWRIGVDGRPSHTNSKAAFSNPRRNVDRASDVTILMKQKDNTTIIYSLSGLLYTDISTKMDTWCWSRPFLSFYYNQTLHKTDNGHEVLNYDGTANCDLGKVNF